MRQLVSFTVFRMQSLRWVDANSHFDTDNRQPATLRAGCYYAARICTAVTCGAFPPKNCPFFLIICVQLYFAFHL